MRTRLVAAALATLSAACFLVGVLPGSAAAAPAVNCTQNPAHNGHTTAHFSGTNINIRTGPFTSCTAVGEGQPGNTVTVRCETTNSNGVEWSYLTDSTTGRTGWSETQFVNTGLGAVELC